MAWSPLDTRWWHLSLGAVATTAAACGPTITLDDGTSETITDSDTDPSDTDPTDTDPTTSPPPACVNNSDCPNPGDECIDNICVPTDYCDDYCCDDYCCYDGCCDGGCYYYECYGPEDCGDGSLCENNYGGGYCVGVDILPECGDAPMLLPIPVEEDVDDPVFSISIVETNGDAARDLVVSHNSGATTLYPGAGVGAAQSLPVAEGDPARAVVSGDFNGDGIADLASLHANGRIEVLAGDGIGFAPIGGLAESPLTDELVALDWNNDGNLDLAGQGQDGLAVMALSDGKGGFAPEFVPSETTQDVAFGNFDGSGLDNDLATQHFEVTRLYYGNDKGTFNQIQELYANEHGPPSLMAGDLDNSGLDDLILQTTVSDSWTLLRGAKNGELNFSSQQAVLDLTRKGAVGDIDGDSNEDAVLIANDAAVVLTGAPDDYVLFNCQFRADLGFSPTMMTAGDFDGDGDDDIIAADIGRVVVLIGP